MSNTTPNTPGGGSGGILPPNDYPTGSWVTPDGKIVPPEVVQRYRDRVSRMGVFGAYAPSHRNTSYSKEYHESMRVKQVPHFDPVFDVLMHRR